MPVLVENSALIELKPAKATGLGMTQLGVPVLDGTLRRYVNLDNAASTPALREVMETVGEFMHWYASVHRGAGFKSRVATQAYEDTSLPIGLGQTISKPNVVARMMELLRHGQPGKLGRVLEIGTGCGYQAAVLSHLATEVYSIERLRGLHDKARDNLRPFRLANVHLLFGDGMAGFPKGAPYAAIIAAAGGEAVAYQTDVTRADEVKALIEDSSFSEAVVSANEALAGIWGPEQQILTPHPTVSIH